MKKILGILAIFAIVGGLSFAQSISVYNEVYSDTVEQRVDEGAGLTFWGVRNRTGVVVNSDKWGIDARYQLRVTYGNSTLLPAGNENVTGDYSIATVFNSDHAHLNIWLKPIEGLTLRFGDDHKRQVAAGTMTAWDGRLGRMSAFDATMKNETDLDDDGIINRYGAPGATIFGGNASRYMDNGFTVEVTAIPYVTLAANLPSNKYWQRAGADVAKDSSSGFILPFNVAADFNIANLFNVGAVYKGGIGQRDTEATVGLYADFVGVKGLKIQAGWTGVVNAQGTEVGKAINGIEGLVAGMSGMAAALGGPAANLENFYKAYADDWKMASLIDLGVQYKFNNGLLLAAAAEMGLGYNWAFPLTVAAYFELPNIVDTLGFSTRVIWENIGFVNKANFYNDNPTVNIGSLRINPNLKYSIGSNAFEIGANFRLGYANATNDTIKAIDKEANPGAVNSFSESLFGFNIPVKWTHYFN